MNLVNLDHEFIHLSEKDKYRPLEIILNEFKKFRKDSNTSAVIFVNSIQAARAAEHKISELGFNVSSLHGDIPPLLRKKYYEDFKNKHTEILVATDLGSRGLDFPFVSHVFNLDFPRTVSDYIHRAGRTGRAGREGYVKSFYRNYDIPIIDEMRKSHEESTPLKIAESAFSLRKTNEKPLRTGGQAVSNPDKRRSHTDPLAEPSENVVLKTYNKSVSPASRHNSKPDNKRVPYFKNKTKDANEPKSFKPLGEKREKSKIQKNFNRFQQKEVQRNKPYV